MEFVRTNSISNKISKTMHFLSVCNIAIVLEDKTVSPIFFLTEWQLIQLHLIFQTIDVATKEVIY